jgi:hypothetical protein
MKKLYYLIILFVLIQSIPVIAEEAETYTLPDIHVIAQKTI